MTVNSQLNVSIAQNAKLRKLQLEISKWKINQTKMKMTL